MIELQVPEHFLVEKLYNLCEDLLEPACKTLAAEDFYGPEIGVLHFNIWLKKAAIFEPNGPISGFG